MEAPFKIGQKVVCINDKGSKKGFKDHSGWLVKKGSVYTIRSVGGGREINGSVTLICTLFEDPDNRTHGWHLTRFAPLPEQRERINYVAVSETLRETAVEIAAVETN